MNHPLEVLGHCDVSRRDGLRRCKRRAGERQRDTGRRNDSLEKVGAMRGRGRGKWDVETQNSLTVCLSS